MTGHDRFLELAAGAIDFELSREESVALEQHLTGCDSCRRRVAAIRADARSIAALSMQPEGWSVPAMAIPATAWFRPASWLRLVAVGALTAALALGAVLVGGEIVRRQEELVNPTISVAPTAPESAAPESAAPESTAPEPPSAAGPWRIERIDAPSLPYGMASVAASGSRLVAVGWKSCAPETDPTDCWANALTSDDGGRTWAAAPRSDALRVSVDACCSGPAPGMLDVAAGHGAFVAIGYGITSFGVAIWRSVDGSSWTLARADPTWDGARVRAVAATATGWVVVGEVHDGPSAAIWSSPDGLDWTREPDGALFDIGGCVDTGEEPSCGGIADVTVAGPLTVGVGKSCDDNGLTCLPAAWTSTGGAWTRSPEIAAGYGELRSVATHGEAVVAAGLLCGLEACAQANRSAGTLRSADGVGWTTAVIPGTSGTVGIRALGAIDGYLVGVVEGVEGIDGVDARGTGELILVGSVDGEAWEILEGPDLGLTYLRDVGIAATADGSLVIVGWGDEQSSGHFASFVVRVSRTPA